MCKSLRIDFSPTSLHLITAMLLPFGVFFIYTLPVGLYGSRRKGLMNLSEETVK